MDASDMAGLFVFTCDNHAYGHNLSSVDAFTARGNDDSGFSSTMAGREPVTPTLPAAVRANGLSDLAGLGLLSEAVGLLKSCIDFQEVIKFLSGCGEPQ